MNKKLALVTLIESSMLLSDDDKLDLIDRVPSLNDQQVEALGKFLAEARAFALANESSIRKNLAALMDNLDQQDRTKVYVGSGKPM